MTINENPQQIGLICLSRARSLTRFLVSIPAAEARAGDGDERAEPIG